jgi:hypothetical protein
MKTTWKHEYPNIDDLINYNMNFVSIHDQGKEKQHIYCQYNKIYEAIDKMNLLNVGDKVRISLAINPNPSSYMDTYPKWSYHVAKILHGQEGIIEQIKVGYEFKANLITKYGSCYGTKIIEETYLVKFENLNDADGKKIYGFHFTKDEVVLSQKNNLPYEDFYDNSMGIVRKIKKEEVSVDNQ